MSTFKPPGQCPVCGEWVPRGAAACDQCGSCAKSGWNDEDRAYDGVDLPDEDFDYDDFVEREFGGEAGNDRLTRQLWWWVALILFLVLLIAYFRP
ncbi:MAG: hypothetical protein KDK97_08250 [Verrucomicrobiales bacterium]|nr:hypothetical protein [Verrucomicrobiales bacterium]MCP5560551.1 hypothetical protein [Verrucomicrobiaceae bacterium]